MIASCIAASITEKCRARHGKLVPNMPLKGVLPGNFTVTPISLEQNVIPTAVETDSWARVPVMPAQAGIHDVCQAWH
jgi:hypothetical protein